MRYQMVIFDMDGTILETLEDIWHSVNVTMDAMGCPRRSYEEVRSFVGNGAAVLIQRCMPQGAEDPRWEQALAYFKDYYGLHAQDKTGPYEGIPELLATLQGRGVKLAVVSNKPDSNVQDLCRAYFPGVFPVVMGDHPDRAKKPAPDSVYAAIDALGGDRACAVYVGDSEVDLATARNAGLPCIAVTWGFRGEDHLLAHGAQVLAHTPDELLELL